MEQLIDFLQYWGVEFTKLAKEMEWQYNRLQKTKKEETEFEQEIERLGDIELSEWLDVLYKYPSLCGPGGGVEWAKYTLSAKTEKTIEALKEADKQINNTIKAITQEPEIYRDKVLEGDIETIKQIASLCAALAGKIEAQETAKEQQE